MSDLIDRQTAYKVLTEFYHHKHLSQHIALKEALDNVPSAEPQRKKGKWTEKEVIHTDEAKEIITEWQSCKCSVCGRYHTQPYMYYFDEPRFCSWCGAEMVKGEEDGHN